MPAFRFFAPLMPLLCPLAAMSLVALDRNRIRTAALVAVIASYNVWQLSHHRDLHHRIVNGKVGYHGKETGLWLKKHARPDAVLATNTAGGLAYYSGLRVIDMLGLNDVHIAHRHTPGMGRGKPGHEKGDGAYVLSRKPDFIQFGSVHGSRRPQYRSGAEMAGTAEFKRWYEFRSYALPSGRRLSLYERRAEPARRKGAR
jgi:arabinofuranosyltransferase